MTPPANRVTRAADTILALALAGVAVANLACLRSSTQVAVVAADEATPVSSALAVCLGCLVSVGQRQLFPPASEAPAAAARRVSAAAWWYAMLCNLSLLSTTEPPHVHPAPPVVATTYLMLVCLTLPYHSWYTARTLTILAATMAPPVYTACTGEYAPAVAQMVVFSISNSVHQLLCNQPACIRNTHFNWTTDTCQVIATTARACVTTSLHALTSACIANASITIAKLFYYNHATFTKAVVFTLITSHATRYHPTHATPDAGRHPSAPHDFQAMTQQQYDYTHSMYPIICLRGPASPRHTAGPAGTNMIPPNTLSLSAPTYNVGYHEQQNNGWCVIHAFNMYWGSCILSGNNVITYCVDRALNEPCMHWHAHFCRREGAFAPPAVNRYLADSAGITRVNMIPCTLKPHSTCTLNDILPFITAPRATPIPVTCANHSIIHNGYCLLIMMNSCTHLRSGHAFTLRLHQDGWYTYDSLGKQPMPFDMNNLASLHSQATAAPGFDRSTHHAELLKSEVWVISTAPGPHGLLARAGHTAHAACIQHLTEDGSNANNQVTPPAQQRAAAPRCPQPRPQCAPRAVQRKRTRTANNPTRKQAVQERVRKCTTSSAKKTLKEKLQLGKQATQSYITSFFTTVTQLVATQLTARSARSAAAPATHADEVRQAHTTASPAVPLTPTHAPNPHLEQTHHDTTPALQNTMHALEGATIYCHNVRGLTSHIESVVHEACTAFPKATGLTPNIIILTETKWIKEMDSQKFNVKKSHLKDYHVYFSCVAKADCPPTRNTNTRVHGKAGVMLAVMKASCNGATPDVHATPEHLHGYVIHITVDNIYGKKVHIVGVYMPPDSMDRATRHAIYHHLTQVCLSCKEEGSLLIMAGDWNAASSTSGRWHNAYANDTNDNDTSATNSMDRNLQTFLTNNNITSVAPCADHTFTRTVGGVITSTSRIDDIYAPISLNPATSNYGVHECGDTFDHKAVYALLPPHNWGLTVSNTTHNAPAATTKRGHTRKLIMPIPKFALEKCKETLKHTLLPLCNNTLAVLRHVASMIATSANTTTPQNFAALTGRVNDYLKTNNTDVNTLSEDIQSVLNNALETMLSSCPSQPTTPPAYTKAYKNQDRNKHSKTRKCIKALKHCISVISRHLGSVACTTTTVTPADGEQAAHEVTVQLKRYPTKWAQKDFNDLIEQVDAVSKMDQTCSTAAWLAINDTIHAKLQAETSNLRALTRAGRKHAVTLARDRFQTLYAKRQKTAHKIVFNPQSEKHDITKLRDPASGKVRSDAEGVNNILHAFFSDLCKPAQGRVKTGAYSTDHNTPRSYPWQQPKSIDPFKLHTPACDVQSQTTLLPYITDPSIFFNCLNYLGNNKAPGPDGLPNELLKILPQEIQNGIFHLLITMYATGTTPAPWKQSTTVLLYKKDDPLCPANYRPIGLANTLYKLWTSVLTVCMSEFAEEHHMLSSCQEGFRRQKNTSRQVQCLLRVLEDAALTSQDVYTLYVDFSSAFNTIDHDQLLQIMYDLGFPADIVSVVKDIYTNNTMHVMSAHGSTPPVHIDRGTIQGDTLSPLLFLVYIEPLLRWLQVGGRGYSFGCLTPKENDQYRSSANAFADDLAITTGCVSDLHIQCTKLTQYLNWTGMRVNHKKCAVTAALYKMACTGLTRSAHNVERIRTLLSEVQISGQPIPIYDPDTPYKYLGIHIAHTLNWSHHVQYLIDLAKAKTHAIVSSLASPRQCARMLESCVRPALAYSFHTACLTKTDIMRLDSIMTRAIKTTYRLPSYFPSVAVRLPVTSMGLGIPSLLTDYVQRNVEVLTTALNDDGRLGVVTRAILSLTQRTADERILHEEHFRGPLRHYTIMKQVALLAKHNITMRKHGVPVEMRTSALGTALATADALTPTLPPNMLMPLLKLGIELHDLLDRSTMQTIISTQQLALLYGKCITRQAKLCLNRVTAALTGQSISETIKTYGQGPLPREARMLPNTLPTAALQPNRLSPAVALPPGSLERFLRARVNDAHPATTTRDTPDVVDPRTTEAEQRELPHKAPAGKQTYFEANSRTRDTSVEADSTRVARMPWFANLKPLGARPPHGQVAPIHGAGQPTRRRKSLPPIRLPQATTEDPATETFLGRQFWNAALLDNPELMHTQNARKRRTPTDTAATDTEPTTQPLPPPQPAPSRPRRRSIAEITADKFGPSHNTIDMQAKYNLPTPGVSQTPPPLGPSQGEEPLPSQQQNTAAQTATATAPTPMWRKAWSAVLTGGRMTGQLLCDLYNEFDVIDEVLCEETLVNTTVAGRRVPHKYYKVAWKPMVLCKSAITAYTAMKYEPEKVTNLGAAAPSLKPKPRVTVGRALGQFLKFVYFKPTSDPAAILRDQPEWDQRLREFRERLETPSDRPARDAHLTNSQRQGSWNSPQTGPDAISRRKKLLEHVGIITTPSMPEYDIPSTGSHTIQVGLKWPTFATTDRTLLIPDFTHPRHDDTAYIYGPDGRFLGAMGIERLAALHRRYDHVKNAHPVTHAEHSAGSFEKDICRLVLREAHTLNAHKRGNWIPHARLLEVFGSAADHIIFTCPSICPLAALDSAIALHSVHACDAIFGFNHTDPLGRKWTDRSLIVAPAESEMQEKLVRWAVHSAMDSDSPAYSIMLVPRFTRNPGYRRIIGTRGVTLIATITNTPEFCCDTWAGRGSAARYRPPPLVDVVFVGNAAGCHAISQDTPLWARISAFLNLDADSTRHLSTTLATAHSQVALPDPTKPPRRFRQASNTTQLRCPPPTDDCDVINIRQAFPCTLFTKVNPNVCIYTDGSARKAPSGAHSIGAGVYDPSRHAAVRINPNGDGPSNTINRAELSAIHYAITTCPPDVAHLQICTDSLCSLYQLRRLVLHPEQMRLSKHVTQLHQIAEALLARADRGLLTILQKVPAHVDCQGNEQADKLACEAADNPSGCVWTDPSDPNPRHRLYWPHTCDPERGPLSLSNTSHAVKRATSASCGAGYAAKTGVYEAAWRSTIPYLDIPHSTKCFAQNSGVPHKTCMTAQQARWGTVYNRKHACRHAKRDMGEAVCPLPNCGRMDSCGHILGGCQYEDMHKQYIQRHDIAVRIISKAILTGDRGNGFLIMDAGAQEDLPSGVAGKRLPEWLLPDVPAEHLAKLRPDILFIPSVSLAETRTPDFAGYTDPSGHTVYILEVGYCSDTRHGDKTTEKEQQHKELVDLLQHRGWSVKLIPITLGHAGTIPRAATTCLTELGASAAATDKALSKLHSHAITTADAIVRLRRTLERRFGA